MATNLLLETDVQKKFSKYYLKKVNNEEKHNFVQVHIIFRCLNKVEKNRFHSTVFSMKPCFGKEMIK